MALSRQQSYVILAKREKFYNRLNIESQEKVQRLEQLRTKGSLEMEVEMLILEHSLLIFPSYLYATRADIIKKKINNRTTASKNKNEKSLVYKRERNENMIRVADIYTCTYYIIMNKGVKLNYGERAANLISSLK